MFAGGLATVVWGVARQALLPTFGEFAAKFAKKTGSDEADMARAVESLEREEEEELAGITKRLSVSLEEISGSYLETFVANYQSQLAQERAKPVDGGSG